MEQRRPARSVPALGKLRLKRVRADEVSSTPPPVERAPPPPPAVRRTVIVGAQDTHVRNAMVASLPETHFEVRAYSDGDAAYDGFQQTSADLLILSKELPGLAGTVLAELLRKGRRGRGLAIVLMSATYTDELAGARDCSAFGADAFLPLPCEADLLHARLDEALSRREPIERLNVLPADMAKEADALFEELDKRSYYQLLAVEYEATPAEIKTSFHNRSLLLHPDRHAKLRDTHPHAWERINTVYKRISEAYKVLADVNTRRSYNLGLRKRGSLRLEPEPQRQREARELAIAESEEARQLVMESVEWRGLGDLESALECVDRALQFEPGNGELQSLAGALEHLISLSRE